MENISKEQLKKIKHCTNIWEYYAENKYTISDSGKCSLNLFLDNLSIEDIEEFMWLATCKIPDLSKIEDRFKYFCGICWRTIKKDYPYSTEEI